MIVQGDLPIAFLASPMEAAGLVSVRYVPATR